MSESEKWSLNDGYCTIQNGEIEVHKAKDKKEKIEKFELADVVFMEKELKHDWLRIHFHTNGKKVKKEYNFKQGSDANLFVDKVLSLSPSNKFNSDTINVGVYEAVRKPLSIFVYLAAFILLIMAIAYGIVFAMQAMNMDTVRVPILLYIPMQLVYALGINKCLMIIGGIGVLCLLGAIVRLVKRPLARTVSLKELS